MKKIKFVFALLLVLGISGSAFAQSVIYTNGNAKIVQLPEGWQILCGQSVVAHGNGMLDIDNLSPAFRMFLDYYASQDEPVIAASKSDEPVYGPLLHTQWAQGAPYNNLCPTISGEHALAGCVTTSSAQILNYYQYCLPLNVSGTGTTSASNISSPYISNIVENDEGITYDFSYSYTPDFEKMKTDDNHLAKFFLAIAFAQKAEFGLDATSTYSFYQQKAMKELYGYEIERFALEDLTTGNYISSAIQKGMPVIVRGEKEAGGGHSFIIDGSHGNEYHVDYGWGGSDNGWFTTTSYPIDMSIFVAHPADTNATHMQTEPKYLNISNENGFSKKIEMVKSESNPLEYKQKDTLQLDAGVYQFCFEYADGTIIAPYADSIISLGEVYEKWGRFVSTPATIELSNSYNVDFWHLQNTATIKVECTDYHMTVSGRVTDKDSNPLEGVYVSTAAAFPSPVAEQKNENKINSVYELKNPLHWYTVDFVATKQNLTKVGFYLWKEGSPNSLSVGILDNDMNVLWHKTLTAEQVINQNWTEVEIDGGLRVKPGNKYQFGLCVDNYNGEDIYNYYISEDEKMVYRVWSCDNGFVKTDADGRYTIELDKHSSSNLSAYHNDYIFYPQRLQKLDSVLSKVDFKGLDAKVTISGSVTDKDSNPLAEVCITTAETIPVPSAEQKNEDDSGFGTRLTEPSYWYTAEFVATQPYLSQVDINVWREKAPNGLTVGILDSVNRVLWQKTLSDEDVVDSGWTPIEIDACLNVEPNVKYYIGLSVESYNGTDYYCYSYSNGDKKMLYRVWSCNAPFVFSDADGNYSFPVDRNFTGTLNAISNDLAFNTITFTNLPTNADDKNFVENGTNIEVNYLPDSIIVMPPFKTDYFVEDTFDNTGMIVYACYADDFKLAVSDYESAGIEFESEGEKNVTITYAGKTAGFKLKVELRRHSITYKVDGKIYAFIDSVVYRTPITAIATPTKEGYTFSGWSQMPNSMPDTDITIKGSFIINKHSIIYMVDNDTLSVVKDVAFGTLLTPIAAPTKEGHTFSGWSQMPDSMPDADVTVTGSFTVNKHSITYMVDNEIFTVVEDVAFGSTIVLIDAPTKDGYKFSGWSQAPSTMPDNDIEITGTFEETTLAATVAAETVKVWAADRTIFIKNAIGIRYTIVDISGRIIKAGDAQSSEEAVTLSNPGIYIVKVGSNVKRVFVN